MGRITSARITPWLSYLSIPPTSGYHFVLGRATFRLDSPRARRVDNTQRRCFDRVTYVVGVEILFVLGLASSHGAAMEAMLNIDLQQVARDVGLPLEKVQSTVELLDEGNTVPFITRFRKDQSGGLNEEQIRQVQQSVKKFRTLADRKQRILKSLESQEKLSEGLAARINAADSLNRLEDLYLPFKPKKQTLAATARSRGLEPFAREILYAEPAAADLQARAADFVNPENGLSTTAEVLTGASHLIAETLSEDLPLRDELRALIEKTGKLVSTRIEEPREPSKAEKTQTAESPESESPKPETRESKARSPESQRPGTMASVARQQAPSESPSIAPQAPEPQDASGEPSAPAATAPPATEPSATEPSATEPSATELAATEPSATEPSATEPASTEPAIEAGPAELVDEHSQSQSAEQQVVEPTTDVVSVATEVPTADQTPSSDEAKSAANDQAAATEGQAKAAADDEKTKAKSKLSIKQIAAKSRKDAKKRKRQKKIESFKDYFNYQEALTKVPHHRLLAINRGERSKILRVKIEADMAAISKKADYIMLRPEHPHIEYLRGCLRDALTRLILPSLEREIRRELTDRAESHAVRVFARNLRQLLLQPPVRDRRVLAIDPGFRSGCKLAAIDEFGNVLGHTVIHVIGKADIVRRGRQQMLEMITMYHIPVLAIGNGTGCRETERMVADILANELRERDVQYVIVNEAGASVYSTSPLGREELPKFDPVLRSAISIGRRLQDPLSELVKINPANIGVGLYQHDVKAKHLEESLDAVVESCVNFVGVDVNTASPSLLRYVSGLNQLTARRLYEYRQQHGPFKNRDEFKKVPGFGDATFVQAAGFLKIIGGDNPLDATWIHPESYDVAEKLIAHLGGDVSDLAASQSSERSTASVKQPKRKFADGVDQTQGADQTVASDVAQADDGPATPQAIQPATAQSAVEPAESGAKQEDNDGSSPAAQEPAEQVSTSAAPQTGESQSEVAAAESQAETASIAADASAADAPTADTAGADQAKSDVPAADPADVASPSAETPASETPPALVASQETPIADGSPVAAAAPLEGQDASSSTVQAAPPLAQRAAKADVGALTTELGVGELLLRDLLSSLTRPGRDPREDLPPPAFRREIIKLEHLQPGMELTGTALNVVDFGAFVDIGLPDSGLIHISRLADRFIKDPHEVVSVGDILTVWVVDVDKQRRRVSLTAIKPGTEKPAKARKERSAGRSKPEHKRGKRDERRSGDRRSRETRRGDRPRTHTVSKPPPPARPITEKMVEGKEPMRSFSDLLQFHEQKTDKKKGKGKDQGKDKGRGSGESQEKS